MSRTIGPHAPSATAWRDVARLVARHRGALVLGLLLTLVGRVAAFGLPWVAKQVVDGLTAAPGARASLPVPLLAAIAGLAIAVEAGAAFGAARVAGRASQRAVARLRTEVQAHVLHLPLAFFDRTPTGNLVSCLVTDAEQVGHLLGPGLVQLAGGLVTAFLAGAVLFTLDARLSTLLLVVLAGAGFGVHRALEWFRRVYTEFSRREADLTAQLGDTLGGIREVKSHAAERHETHRFARRVHAVVRQGIIAVAGTSALTAVIALTTGVVSLVVLVGGAQAVHAGRMTLGDLAMYGVITGLVTNPMIQVAALSGEVGRAVAALGRLGELRAEVPEASGDGSHVPSRCSAPVPVVGWWRGGGERWRSVAHVAFVRVSYVYPMSCGGTSRGGTRLAALRTPRAGPLALADVSFLAPVGGTIALVGPSGAGKTTVLRLLQAFDDPTHGEILVGEGGRARPLRTWDRRAWRRQLGVVGQEPFLFDGTIRDNIAYANSAAGDAAVARAARLAHCDEFVRRLAAGYDTPVGERGVQLSGGQRQRIAIARALLADPPILILDEATSSLDSESELLIQDALRAVERGRTTFVIAHRLATVRHADQILVLERGEIVERGTHDTLLARRGRYARACALQARGPGADADWVWTDGSGTPRPPSDD